MNQPAPPAGFYMDGDPHVSAQRFVEHYCGERGHTPADVGISSVVVGTYHRELTAYLAELSGAKPLERLAAWKGDGFTLGGAVTIMTMPLGAAFTVACMEEMFACGMRTLITTGTAGSLQPHAPIGTLVVPTTAIREEGVSHHYAPHDVAAAAHPEIVAALRARLDQRGMHYVTGVNWTTDAIYREHRQKVDRYCADGVVSVDMELSAIFTVGAVLGMRCGAIVAISDELYGATWDMGFGGESMRRGQAKAGRVALHVAAQLAGLEQEV
jgi:uridine phosphorylase